MLLVMTAAPVPKNIQREIMLISLLLTEVSKIRVRSCLHTRQGGAGLYSTILLIGTQLLHRGVRIS